MRGYLTSLMYYRRRQVNIIFASSSFFCIAHIYNKFKLTVSLWHFTFRTRHTHTHTQAKHDEREWCFTYTYRYILLNLLFLIYPFHSVTSICCSVFRCTYIELSHLNSWKHPTTGFEFPLITGKMGDSFNRAEISKDDRVAAALVYIQSHWSSSAGISTIYLFIFVYFTGRYFNTD